MENPNMWAVLGASLLPMIIGSLWYGPLFGRLWMRLIEITEDEIKASFNPLKSYGVTYIGAFLTAYVLAHILQAYAGAFDVSGTGAGVEGAFWVWLGFVLTIGWQAVAFENKKISVYALNMAYNLITLLLMGAVLGTWR